MRKLFALAAVAVFALTLSLGTIGCAPKAEEAPVTETPAVEAPAVETPAAPMDSTMGGTADTTTSTTH